MTFCKIKNWYLIGKLEHQEYKDFYCNVDFSLCRGDPIM